MKGREQRFLKSPHDAGAWALGASGLVFMVVACSDATTSAVATSASASQPKLNLLGDEAVALVSAIFSPGAALDYQPERPVETGSAHGGDRVAIVPMP